MKKHKRAVYTNTGLWSTKAIKEAKKFGEVCVAGDSSKDNFSFIPETNWNTISQETDYIHITANNTIYGTAYHQWPSVENVPLVVDMSSNILSDESDLSRAGLVYASAQKNIGSSGLTVLILSKSWVESSSARAEKTPLLLDYDKHIRANSMINTPPSFSVYLAGLVFEWLLDQGGLSEMKERNQKKANHLYETIDNLDFFDSAVRKSDRSLMNIPFSTRSQELDNLFIAEAKECGLVNLKGHRSVGGMRASIYNAMPFEGVEKLVSFMEKFSKKNQ